MKPANTAESWAAKTPCSTGRSGIQSAGDRYCPAGCSSRRFRPKSPHPTCRGGVGFLPTPRSGLTSSRSASSPTSRAAPRPSGSPGSFGRCLRRSSRPLQRRWATGSGACGSCSRWSRRVVALAASAVAAFADAVVLVPPSHPVRPRLHADWTHPACPAPSSLELPRTDRVECGDLDDREPRDSIGPLFAGVLVSVADVGLVFASAAESSSRAQRPLARVRVEAASTWLPPRPPKGA